MDLKDGWIKKLIFNGLEASYFHNHFALTTNPSAANTSINMC